MQQRQRKWAKANGLGLLLAGALYWFPGTAADTPAAIGQPSIFWRNGEWQTYKDGVWTPYFNAEPATTGKDSPADERPPRRKPQGQSPAAAPTTQPATGIGQPTIGIGQPNGQIGPQTDVIGQPNGQIGQTTIGTGQTTIGIGQPNSQIGQQTIGIGEPNTQIGQTTIGIGQPNGQIGSPTIAIGQPNTQIGQNSFSIPPPPPFAPAGPPAPQPSKHHQEKPTKEKHGHRR